MLGFFSLALVAAAALASGARALSANLSVAHTIPKLAGAGLTAVVVSVLEEILYRGAVFGVLRRAFNWVFALTVSSMIYALVHFMEGARLDGSVQWYSGLELLPRMLRGFGNWHELVPGFFNLTLVGALLALAYERTGNLYCSIGLHGGWIFWLKSYGALTCEPLGANNWLWGSSKLIDGWLSLVVLMSTLLIFVLLPLGRRTAPLAAPAEAPH